MSLFRALPALCLERISAALKAGEVHMAKEATVGALLPIRRENYQARPVFARWHLQKGRDCSQHHASSLSIGLSSTTGMRRRTKDTSREDRLLILPVPRCGGISAADARSALPVEKKKKGGRKNRKRKRKKQNRGKGKREKRKKNERKERGKRKGKGKKGERRKKKREKEKMR